MTPRPALAGPLKTDDGDDVAITMCKGDFDKGSNTAPGGPTGCTHETTFEGAVLETRERNGYDDSDFYAVVWDEAEGKVRTVEYASTRFWTYHNGAKVDATDEAKAKAAAWIVEHRGPLYARYAVEDAEAAARELVKGCRARVVKGRKVPVGTEGVVIWMGNGNWGPRVGIKDAAGEAHWTAADNVERIDAEPVDAEAIEADAIRGVEAATRAMVEGRRSWVMAVPVGRYAVVG